MTQGGLFLQALALKFPLSSVLGKDKATSMEKLLNGSFPEGMTDEIKKWVFSQEVSKAPQKTLTDILERRLRLFNAMHPTWRRIITTSLPESLQPLASQLLDDESIEHLHSDVRTVLLNDLLRRSGLFERTDEISSASLEWLGKLSCENLLSLIDLVAMVDVTEEVRHIVDKKTLQVVLSHLSDVQQKYLKSLLHMPSKAARIPIQIVQKIRHGLSKEQIRAKIQERGLKRMSTALRNEPLSLVWHVTHTLDLTRGQYVEEERVKEDPEMKNVNLSDLHALFAHAYQFLQNEKSPGARVR